MGWDFTCSVVAFFAAFSRKTLNFSLICSTFCFIRWSLRRSSEGLGLRLAAGHARSASTSTRCAPTESAPMGFRERSSAEPAPLTLRDLTPVPAEPVPEAVSRGGSPALHSVWTPSSTNDRSCAAAAAASRRDVNSTRGLSNNFLTISAHIDNCKGCSIRSINLLLSKLNIFETTTPVLPPREAAKIAVSLSPILGF